MAWIVVTSLSLDCGIDAFNDAIDVWIKRPNVCSKIVSCANVQPTSYCVLSAYPPLTDTLVNVLSRDSGDHSDKGKSLAEHCLSIRELFVRKLFPKNPPVHSETSEIVLVKDFVVIFIPICGEFYPNPEEVLYKLELIPNLQNLSLHTEHPIQNKFCLNLSVIGDKCGGSSKTCAPSRQWLSEKLLPRLVKWAKCSEISKVEVRQGQKLPESLSLIPQSEYAPMYQSLKTRYGKKLAEMWQEVTDPQKYVFEDIAIATYLILLWKLERKLNNIDKLQSFIDLGCGNGLLVHILNSEGHPGVGVDIRCRKIWSQYPKTTILHENTIDPTGNDSYNQYDWLLGNHSDELTPWLPVLAARSGFHVRYWVLPCCFHDFFAKYERSSSTSSQYEDYLNFVEDIGRRCGFNVEVDVLRIPSTKRICHIGMRKTYPPANHEEILRSIQQFIDERKRTNRTFEAREKTEKVRNCTKLTHSLQNGIIKIIVEELLKTSSYTTIPLESCILSENEIQTPDHVPHLELDNATSSEDTKPKTVDASSGLMSRQPYRGLHPARCSVDRPDRNRDSSTKHVSYITQEPAPYISSVTAINNFSESNKIENLNTDTSHINTNKSLEDTEYRANNFRSWNRGGILSLEQAASLITEDTRSHMKKECGGLQTLLRNHHQVFEIVNGNVKLRDWSSLKQHSRRRKKKSGSKECTVKKKSCWFYYNHPDGCPRLEEFCPFLHADREDSIRQQQQI